MRHIYAALLFALAASGLAGPAAAVPANFEQRAVDGDTIAIGKARYRLWGVDAPEKAQKCRKGGKEWDCGAWSGEMLAKDMAKGRVECEAVNRDRYDRIVAICRVNGMDLAEAQVKRGAAQAYPQYTKRYVAMAEKAKAQKVGVWAGEMIDPAEYRRNKRNGTVATPQPEVKAAAKSAATAPKGCAIKGNINAKGVKIYHKPGQRDYDKTKITPETGEAYFCSEQQARAAGFTAAKQ